MILVKNKKGSILITSLWITSILSLLALGLGFRSSIELRLSKYSIEKIQARYLAEAGFYKMKELLSKDGNAYDNLYECGVTYNSIETPAAVFGFESNNLPGGAFAVYYDRESEEGTGYEICYGMMDEDRKLNIDIDRIPLPDKAGEYRRIFGRLSPALTAEIVNAMMDWQDPDSDVTLPGGAEDADYEMLEHPYKCKNKPFECIEELFMVKGMTRAVFDAIKDRVTVYSGGQININTASRETLDALINDDSGVYLPLVNKIVTYRDGADGKEGTKDDGYFMDLNDISKKVVLDEAESARMASLANYFIFKSDNFRIISRGRLRKITQTVTWIVERGSGKMKYYHEE